MTERLRHALDEYRTRTKVAAGVSVATGVLEGLGIADRYTALESPIGPVFVSWNARGVVALRQAANAEGFERWFRRRFERRVFPATERPELIGLVQRALGGEKVEVPLDLRDSTAFETAVLEKARQIPKGHARPYAWIAREIAHPRAVRAVGSALAKNPVPLLIPCHRVVRSDYTCGEYVFGSERKRELLESEGLPLDEIQALARRGVRYIGRTEGNWFCLPTCGTDVLEDEHTCLHTIEEALARGLRPCGVCRPVAA